MQPSLEAGLKQPTAEARAMRAKGLKVPLALGHTFLSLAVFLPPFMLCINLGVNPDVAYFCGRGALVALLLLPLLFALPAVHLYMRPPNTFFLASIWIPAALFAAIGGVFREKTWIASNAMENNDCDAFAEKRDLFEAYKLADEIRKVCVGVPGYEEASITQCPQYAELHRTWGREFSYLWAMERRFECAGICNGGPRLWDSDAHSAPPCRMFVGQWLHSAYVQSCMILWYSAVILVLSAVGYQFCLVPFLTDLGYIPGAKP